MLDSGAMEVTFRSNTSSDKAIVIINPTHQAVSYDLTGDWNLIANQTKAGSEVIETQTGTVTVDAISVSVYVNHSR